MKDYPQEPTGGKNRLKELLDHLHEDQEQLKKHPIYKEGFDDGYASAQQNHKRLAKAIASVYRIDEWSDQ